MKLYSRRLSAVCSFLFFFLFFPQPSFALQVHPYPEGLYVHQLGHLFFVSCMTVFIYRLYRRQLNVQYGWNYFFYGSIFLIIWNIWAVVGHWVALHIAKDQIVLKPGEIVPYLFVNSFLDGLYYLLAFDHLFCVPALFLFYLGLRNMRSNLRQAQQKNVKERR